MSSSPLRRIAGFLLAAFFASVLTRKLFGPAEHLPADALERPWTATQVGTHGFQLDAPWKLEPVSMPLPSQLAGRLRDPPVYYGHVEDAGGVMAARFPIARDQPADLDGAATGMVEQMRKTPGTRGIESRRRETTLLGERAIEVTSRIDREGGKPLRSVGVMALKNGDLVQVSVMTMDDDPIAERLWSRVRDSVRE
jgi:hypothetical protein